MAAQVRVAERGDRTIYAEHGIWYDAATGWIHVTIPGQEGAHWSYKERNLGRPDKDRMFAMYRRMLQEQGRWPT